MTPFGVHGESSEEARLRQARWRALPSEERAQQSKKNAHLIYFFSWVVAAGAVFILLTADNSDLEFLSGVVFFCAGLFNIMGYITLGDVERELKTPAEVPQGVSGQVISDESTEP